MKIGFVFQKFNLLPTLTAEGNIEIARDIAGKSDEQADREYIERITACWASTSAWIIALRR